MTTSISNIATNTQHTEAILKNIQQAISLLKHSLNEQSRSAVSSSD